MSHNITGQATYNFVGECELDTEFTRIYNEVYDRLLTLRLTHTQIEPITDMLTELNYESFILGFNSAYAVNLIKGDAAS